ncbi:MAG: hypothetical protein OXM02_13685 [Bacteroidota bacterium]|nr:hypothetical protein [Bacteroidota bacterium]MDE2835548.1 hypothetical protein [Bacteroidota bacterium]
MRGLLLELPKACMEHEVKSGRKSKFWSPREKAVFQSVNTSHKWRNMAKVEAYFAVCRQLVARDQGHPC